MGPQFKIWHPTVKLLAFDIENILWCSWLLCPCKWCVRVIAWFLEYTNLSPVRINAKNANLFVDFKIVNRGYFGLYLDHEKLKTNLHYNKFGTLTITITYHNHSPWLYNNIFFYSFTVLRSVSFPPHRTVQLLFYCFFFLTFFMAFDQMEVKIPHTSFPYIMS